MASALRFVSRPALDADAPDSSYWTAYDHFMIEREARALRRAYTWSLLARGLRAVKQRVAAALPTPDSASRPTPRRA